VRRWLACAACAVVAAGCASDQGPTAGELSVRLATARPADRAVLFTVTGHLHGVSAASGSVYRVFADTAANGDTARVVVVAPAGTGLLAGELARVRVDDVRKAGSYVARVIDAATAAYTVGDTAGMSLSVVKP